MLTLNSNNPIKAELSHHGAFGGMVQARHDKGDEAVCFVTYAAVGTDFVITSFGVNPRATVKEAQLGGDAIDAVLETEAHKAGIKRLLIVHPNRDTAEVVRSYALQPFTMGMSVTKNPIAYLN
jgi:hypothetical protein